MRRKRLQNALVFCVTVLILAGVIVLSSDLLFASAGDCEDYCYDWFWSCYSRPEFLNYCTDHMMDCLANCYPMQ